MEISTLELKRGEMMAASVRVAQIDALTERELDRASNSKTLWKLNNERASAMKEFARRTAEYVAAGGVV